MGIMQNNKYLTCAEILCKFKAKDYLNKLFCYFKDLLNIYVFLWHAILYRKVFN